MANFHDLNIKNILRETNDSVVISFEIPKELLKKYVYSAGQYTSLKVIINGKEIIRDYSICSHNDEDLSIGVKKLENGLMSSFLNSSIKIGDSMKVSEPRGRFTIQDDFNNIIAIAAGSGITPIMSMLKQTLFNTDKTFFDLTKPASSIQKPHAINITRKPAIKNKSELRINIPCSGNCCARAGEEKSDIVVTKLIK